MKKTLTAFALAAAFAVPAAAQQPAAAPVKNLKFQSTWPASLTLQDNFKMFAERVDKLTGGQVKIEAAAAGQFVSIIETDMLNPIPRITKLSTAGLSQAITTMRQRCNGV